MQAGIQTSDNQLRRPLYALAGLVSVVVWFLPYRAPLWLDETVSFWEINGGFAQIWSRTVEGLSFPAYPYILWMTNELLGSREVVLRAPSVLAMLAATYVLFRIAREFFDEDAAVAACIIFALHKDVAFAAIDARPYAFGVLATNLAIYTFVLWMRRKETRLALLLGISTAGIFYFHYLFGVILPAFVIYYLIEQGPSVNKDLKQIGVTVASFIVIFLPVIPRLRYLVAGGRIFSFSSKPHMIDYLLAFLPGVTPYLLVGVAAVAYLRGKLKAFDRASASSMFLALLLAVVPITILFATAIATPLQVFVGRYRLEAVPGIALVWGALVYQIRGRLLKQAFSLLLVAVSVFVLVRSPRAWKHGYTWKYALEFAQRNAGPDRAPLLICSDLPSADYQPMPIGRASESMLFAPLTYYKVTVPVVPLSRALNDEAKRVGGNFILEAARTRKRFLALAFKPSYPTVNWLASVAQKEYSTRMLGTFDEIIVMEFQSRGASDGGEKDTQIKIPAGRLSTRSL